MWEEAGGLPAAVVHCNALLWSAVMPPTLPTRGSVVREVVAAAAAVASSVQL